MLTVLPARAVGRKGVVLVWGRRFDVGIVSSRCKHACVCASTVGEWVVRSAAPQHSACVFVWHSGY